MFERYTESARRALFFARVEVGRFGGTSIGTEHILIGVTRASQGITDRILAQANTSSVQIREAVEAGLSVVERVPTSLEIPFTDDTHRALILAVEEADRLRHPYVGTEHLLLGLLGVPESAAAGVLAKHGLRVETARNAVVTFVNERFPGIELSEADGPVGRIRLLVQQLGSLATDGDEARALITLIKRELDDLEERLSSG